MHDLHLLAPWAGQGCKQAIRTVSCMFSAAFRAESIAGKTYCRQNCENYLTECDEVVAIVGDAFAALREDCQTLADDSNNCISPKGLASDTGPAAVCPEPLVTPDSASSHQGATVHWAEGSACAVPCPNELV